MGGSSWSDDNYYTRSNTKLHTRGTVFVHDADIKSGVVAPKVHNLLDPKGLKMRESRDSATHPESNAIIVWLDVTGSMGSVVKTIHGKLPTLMGLLTRKNYITDPQLLFGAIGDANSDKSPLQVGQFESGDEMEGDLGNFHIEGNGGGQDMESYELGAYVGANHTDIDCLNKRGKKGYCFFIGDENPYPSVSKSHVDRIIGPGLQENTSTEEVFKALQEKYVVFFILPRGASHGSRLTERKKIWGKYVGDENVLLLEDAEAIAELIATQIGLCEGTTDIDAAVDDLKSSGSSDATVALVRSAVSRGSVGGRITRIDPGAIVASGDPSSVKRL